MKKRIIKIINFFRREHLFRYAFQFLLFFIILIVFFWLAAEDVISNMVGAVIGFIFSAVALYFGKLILSRLEDMLKISYDTKQLLELYKGEPSCRKTLELGGTSQEFAYVHSLINDGYTFEVKDDPDKNFELDDFIMGNYPLIFSAHASSVKFNSKTIRLDDFVFDGKKGVFHLSRSTIFNHLVTNRAIDFSLFDNVTLRSIYEYGPTLSDYKDSKMSNHIGINGLVFLSDGFLVVPQRNKASTISKNRVTSSIAVRLEFPKAGGQDITCEHLMDGTIRDNLANRLHLSEEEVKRAQPEIQFLGFGKNVYEGGKPQFYYAVRLRALSSEQYLNILKKRPAPDSSRLDQDKCIHIADYHTMKFVRDGRLTFKVLCSRKRMKKVTVEYEMSYLNNLWHYKQANKDN